ncbi:ABC transporter substrate-binding protein [Frankia sp. AiPa1]|nr:ABC transporter substrate-binding protein [Frankia sp. AiPa1]
MAACSSDSSGSTGSAASSVDVASIKAGPATGWDDGGQKVDPAKLKCSQTASDPTRGITDTQITVGGLAYLTSASGASMSGAEAGAKARFARANAEGGVNGRKINYVGTLDDGNDPARTSSQAKVLVEQKKIFASVPLLTTNASYLDTFCNETVPYFGWGINSGFCNSSLGFGITGCLIAGKDVKSSTNYGLLINALFGGNGSGKTVALVGNDDDTARAGVDAIGRQLKAVGIKVVYSKTPVPDAGLSDAAPIVNGIMTADGGAPPDVLIYGTDFNATLKLTEALKAAGFKGKNLNAVGYDPRLAAAKLPGLEGSYTSLQWAPGSDTAVPGIKQMVSDIRKYTPGTVLSLPTMAGYWSADMFLAAAKKAGRDLTLTSLLKLMNNNYSYSVDGALAETRWPLNHLVSNPCFSLVQLNGSKYDITVPLSCGSFLKS